MALYPPKVIQPTQYFFSRNEIVIELMSSYYQNLNFRFECVVWIYNEVGALLGVHTQAGVPDDTGKFGFQLQGILHAFLQSAVPAANNITRGSQAVLNFQVEVKEFWGEPATFKRVALDGKHFAFLGGIDPRRAPSLNYFGQTTRFQTWAPSVKLVGPGQEDYLSLLTALAGHSDSVYLHARINWDDNTSTQHNLSQAVAVANTFLHLPAGFTQLNLASKNPTKKAISYALWVSGSVDPANPLRRSEERTYLLDYNNYPTARTFLYLNSLGGWETIRCTGSFRESWEEEHDIATRMVPYTSAAFTSPLFSYNHSAKITVKGNTGRQLSRAWQQHLREFTLSREVYELTPAGRTRVLIKPAKYDIRQDRNNEMSIDFEYSYSHYTHSYTP